MNETCDFPLTERKRWQKPVRPSRHREMARQAVEGGRASIRHACWTFTASETCYRHPAQASEEDARIVAWVALDGITPMQESALAVQLHFGRQLKNAGITH